MGPHRIEPSSHEVQVVFNSVYIAKTVSPLLVWESSNKPPQYYLPGQALAYDRVDIRPLTEDFGRKDNVKEQRTEEEGEPMMMLVGGKSSVIRIFRSGSLEGYVRLEFGEMDAWFESGALVRLPPKNPSRRIDTPIISARITVTIGNTLVAEAYNAVKLLETGLPARYYISATGVVDWSVVVESESGRVSACPYKGEARYFDVDIQGEKWRDVAWYYLYPVAESGPIAGRLCFDAAREGVRVEVDGVEQSA